MFQFLQQILLLGPQASSEAADGGTGSYTALGTAAALVAVAIWRRGRRD